MSQKITANREAEMYGSMIRQQTFALAALKALRQQSALAFAEWCEKVGGANRSHQTSVLNLKMKLSRQQCLAGVHDASVQQVCSHHCQVLFDCYQTLSFCLCLQYIV